jgi:hypothetical protein
VTLDRAAARLEDEVTVHFRGNDGQELYHHVAQRVGPRPIPVVMRRDLLRYYRLLDAALEQAALTRREAELLVDACRLGAKHGLILEIVRRIQDEQLDLRHQVDADQLIAKLEQLSDLQRTAVLDAVERYWIEVKRPKEPREAETTVKTVGLVRSPQRTDGGGLQRGRWRTP